MDTDPPTIISIPSCGMTCADSNSVEAKRITASLPWLGFDPFDAVAGVPSSEKYLKRETISTHPAVGLICLPERVSTEDIDPFTGISCLTGNLNDSSVYLYSQGNLCGSVDTEPCTTTSTTKTTLPISIAEDCDHNEVFCTVTSTLSQSYTLDDVAENVRTLLGKVQFGDLPVYDVDATVIAGSYANTVAAIWNPAASKDILSASNLKQIGGATRSIVQIRFLNSSKVKFYFYQQSGGDRTQIGDEQTFDAGEELTLFPPDELGTNTIEVTAGHGCSNCKPSSSITPRTSWDSTSESTDFGFGGGGFIGTDCKIYRTVKNVSSQSINSETSSSFSVSYPSAGGTFSSSSTSNGSSNSSFTMTETLHADPNLSRSLKLEGSASSNSVLSVYESQTPGNSYSGLYTSTSSTSVSDNVATTTITYTGESFYSDRPSENYSTTYSYDGGANFGAVRAEFVCDYENTSTDTDGNWTTTNTENFKAKASEVGVGYTTNYSATFDRTVVSDGFSFSSNTDASFKQTFSDESPYAPSNPVVESHGPDEDAKLTAGANIVARLGTSLGSVQESVDIEFNTDVTVPNTAQCSKKDNESINFTTYVHWVVQEDDESGSPCHTRTVRAMNEQHNFSSARGEQYSVTDYESLTPSVPTAATLTELFHSRGRSSAIIHYAAKTVAQ